MDELPSTGDRHIYTTEGGGSLHNRPGRGEANHQHDTVEEPEMIPGYIDKKPDGSELDG